MNKNVKEPRYDISLEYQSLREELIQAKRYVFERPLLIVTAFFASLNFVKSEYSALLPFLLIALMLFNFWFTVNRLRSMARIVAYIQVVLDNKDTIWIGWENFLRFYRKWLKKRSDMENKSFINENIEKDAVPDALMYFPPIFNFHLGIVIICIIGSIYFLISDPNILNIISLVLTLSFGFFFFKESIKYRPGKMKMLIERDRVICIDVQKSIEGQSTSGQAY